MILRGSVCCHGTDAQETALSFKAAPVHVDSIEALLRALHGAALRQAQRAIKEARVNLSERAALLDEIFHCQQQKCLERDTGFQKVYNQEQLHQRPPIILRGILSGPLVHVIGVVRGV
eukprot:5811897-Alexandrium_andersonii.AAC.1